MDEVRQLPDARIGVDIEALRHRFRKGDARIGVIGLGYVGLPLATAAAGSGFTVTGFDIDRKKVDLLNQARSYIRHISSSAIAELTARKRFRAVTDFAEISTVDAVLICVPTPLTAHRDPDLSYVVGTGEAILPHLRRGQLVILESTTYPGTSRDVLRPILERRGLRSGIDFFLAYSPEREDPGNSEYPTARIPKVVGGDGDDALSLAQALYERFIAGTVPVTSLEAAEAVKLTENIFRAVNIALVNELKVIYDAMGIDIWQVIDAARTKPFGYMPFFPGPGLGGHCIPIDPFYLAWKARAFGITTRFIELAGEINSRMPMRVVARLSQALNDRHAKSLKGAEILLLGVAYKRNVDDTRESPSFKIMEILEARGARVAFHDPYVPSLSTTREYPQFAGRRSVPLDRQSLAAFDAAVICADHDEVDYRLVAEHCPLVVDTRNVCEREGVDLAHVIKA